MRGKTPHDKKTIHYPKLIIKRPPRGPGRPFLLHPGDEICIITETWMDLLICLVKLPKRRQTEEVIESRRNPDPGHLMGVSEREVKSESQRRGVSKAKALNNITCSDDKAGTLIVPVPSLALGASTTVTGSYVPTTSPSTDTLTCIGTGEISNKSVSSSGSATCTPAVVGVR